MCAAQQEMRYAEQLFAAHVKHDRDGELKVMYAQVLVEVRKAIVRHQDECSVCQKVAA